MRAQETRSYQQSKRKLFFVIFAQFSNRYFNHSHTIPYFRQGIEFQGWVKLELDSEIADTDQVNDAVLEVLDAFNYELFPNASFVATTVKNAMVGITSECPVLYILYTLYMIIIIMYNLYNE